MGDSYELQLICAYCGGTNDDVWYAPSSEVDTFKCESCGKKNGIGMSFYATTLNLTSSETKETRTSKPH
jgi:hypothetical protein